MEPDQLGVCKTGFPEVLSYQTLHAKDSTDLECTRKLQAFKKASSLMGLGIQALGPKNEGFNGDESTASVQYSAVCTVHMSTSI